MPKLHRSDWLVVLVLALLLIPFAPMAYDNAVQLTQAPMSFAVTGGEVSRTMAGIVW